MKLTPALLIALTLALPAAAASDAKGPFGWLMDPTTNWAFAALVVFLLIVWRLGAFKAVFGGLDKRRDAIADELEEAKSLREQAAETLARAERRQQDADKEAEAIIEQAKSDAKAMVAEQRDALAASLARREAMAEARIARAEAEAAEDVRRAAADAATEAAKRLLKGDASADQFEAAAADIEKALS